MMGGSPTSVTAQPHNHTIIISVTTLTEGVMSNITNKVWGFAKAHPVLTAAAGMYAWDAIKKYNEAKSKALTFYAKDTTEKNRMSQVITQMTKSGYKLVTQQYKGATGYEWKLTRTT